MSEKWAKLNVTWSRRGVIAVIILGLLGIFVSVALFIYRDENQEIPTETIESSEAPKGSPTVSISSIHVSEVAMDVAAAFELEIQAGGVSKIPACDINIVLDFGRAEIEACDYAPKPVVTNVVVEGKSHRRFEVSQLGQKEKLYIRCLISSPTFNQILINGGNLRFDESMSFESYMNYNSKIDTSFFETWSKVVFVVFTIIFFFWFCSKLFG